MLAAFSQTLSKNQEQKARMKGIKSWQFSIRKEAPIKLGQRRAWLLKRLVPKRTKVLSTWKRIKMHGGILEIKTLLPADSTIQNCESFI